jgi:hypothetical protein
MNNSSMGRAARKRFSLRATTSRAFMRAASAEGGAFSPAGFNRAIRCAFLKASFLRRSAKCRIEKHIYKVFSHAESFAAARRNVIVSASAPVYIGRAYGPTRDSRQ